MHRYVAASSDAPGIIEENHQSGIFSRAEAPGKKSSTSPLCPCQTPGQSAGKFIFPTHLIFLSCDSRKKLCEGSLYFRLIRKQYFFSVKEPGFWKEFSLHIKRSCGFSIILDGIFFFFQPTSPECPTTYGLGQLDCFVSTPGLRTKLLAAPTKAGASLFQCGLTQIPPQKYPWKEFTENSRISMKKFNFRLSSLKVSGSVFSWPKNLFSLSRYKIDP